LELTSLLKPSNKLMPIKGLDRNSVLILLLSRIVFGSIPFSTKIVFICPQSSCSQYFISTIDSEVNQYPIIDCSEPSTC